MKARKVYMFPSDWYDGRTMPKKPVKIRRSWKIKPATRVEKDSKKYDRKTEKRKLRRLLEQ